MSLLDWADQIVMDLDVYDNFERLSHEYDWQNWGARLIANIELTDNLPSPYHFTDWREWAERICQTI